MSRRTESVDTTLTASEVEALDRIARDRGTSRQDAVRAAILTMVKAEDVPMVHGRVVRDWGLDP